MIVLYVHRESVVFYSSVVWSVSAPYARCLMAAVALVSCLMGVVSAGFAMPTSCMQLEELWHVENEAVRQIKAIMEPVAELSDRLQRSVEYRIMSNMNITNSWQRIRLIYECLETRVYVYPCMLEIPSVMEGACRKSGL